MPERRKGRRPRRQFDEEFRSQAVRLVLDDGKTIGAVARDLDLTPSALRLWVRRAQPLARTAAPVSPPPSARSSPGSAKRIASCGWSATS
jgi:transposase-like protein